MKRFAALVLAVAMLLAVVPASALAESYLEATGGRVNVRSGPGTSYSRLYTLVRGEKVTYTGESARDSRGVTWYKIQYYAYGTGWVSSKYSAITSDGSSTASSASCVQATGNVNIRNAPRLSGKSLGTIAKGKTAAYLGSSSTDDRGVVWYYVSYNGTVGWVSSRYAKLCSGSSGSGSSSSGSSGSASYVTATGNVNIRNAPQLTGKDLGTIAKGKTAAYLGSSSTDDRGVVWYYVSYNGTAGWVSSRYAKLS